MPKLISVIPAKAGIQYSLIRFVYSVIPAKAGIQYSLICSEYNNISNYKMDSWFRRNDIIGEENINIMTVFYGSKSD